MGREIQYCCNCQTRLLGVDFDKGKAQRLGDKVCCSKCAPGILASLTPEQRAALTRPAVTETRRTSTPKAVQRFKPPTSRRISPVSRMSDSEDVDEMPSYGSDDASRKKMLLWGGIGAGGLLLAVIVVVAALVSGNGKPEEPNTTGTPGTSGTQPPPPTPGGGVKDPGKLTPLEKARKYVKENPRDFAGQVRLYTDAMWALESKGSPDSVTAKRELDEVLEWQWKTLEPELTAIRKEVEDLCGRQEYGKALDKLDEAARQHADVPKWKNTVGIDANGVWKQARDTLEELTVKAQEARGSGNEKEVERIRDQVKAWGLEKCLRDFEDILGSTVVMPGDTTPPEPVDKPPSEALKAYRTAWKEAMATATARKFSDALAALEDAARGSEDEDVRSESSEDIKKLERAKKLYEQALEALSKWPKGETLALVSRDEPGKTRSVSGKVVSIDADKVELDDGGRPAFVDFSEATLASLIRARQNPPEGRAPKRDMLAEVLLCLLEGKDARDQARGVKLPDKYWEYMKKAASHLPKPDARELEARRLLAKAEEEFFDQKTFGQALESYKRLIAEFAATRCVARNMKIILPRSEAGKEYFFIAGDLNASGTFKLVKDDEVGTLMRTTESVEGVATLSNYVEVNFHALPETEYRCWIRATACCSEGFELEMQATDLQQREVMSRKMISVAPDSSCTLPVKARGVYFRVKKHEQHQDKEAPRKWYWISIPLPEYPAAGPKTIRLITSRKGLSIAYVLVTSLAKTYPKDPELKELLEARAKRPPPRPRQMLLWWKFDEGGGEKVSDASGKGNDGTLMKGAKWVEGKIGGAIELDGSDDTVEVPDGPELKLGKSNFSVCLWIHPADKEPRRLVSKWNNRGFFIDVHSDNRGRKREGTLRIVFSDGTKIQYLLGGPMGSGKWQHIAFTVDREKGIFIPYVDGKKLAELDISKIKNELDADKPLIVGTVATDRKRHFKGRVDDLRVYLRVLKPEEVSALAK